MNTICIKTGTNAKESGYFDSVYNYFNGASRFEFYSINLRSDGGLDILIFMPSPTPREKDAFFNRPVKFYQKELQNGTYSTSVRGIANIDVVFDPTIYPRELIDNILKKEFCTAYLIDTNTNKIIGVRVLSLNEKVYEEFHKSCVTMLENGLTSYAAMEGLRKYVLPISAERLQKISNYIGREKTSTIVENLIMFSV